MLCSNFVVVVRLLDRLLALACHFDRVMWPLMTKLIYSIPREKAITNQIWTHNHFEGVVDLVYGYLNLLWSDLEAGIW